tara:strand:+ start:469 stop:660 length:192 start_codon:yes stop_codon:yes gene_type:complete
MSFAAIACVLLSACVGKSALEHETLSQADSNLKEFFDGHVLNRAYMKKYGVGLGEVLITFEKS